MAGVPITQIDLDKCTGCGLCVEICPSKTLTIVDGKAEVTGDDSMQCAQCVAICPEEAVSLPGIDSPKIDNLPKSQEMDVLLHVMRERRSVRKYKSQTVERAVLDDLVKVGTLAPSGTNSQKWTFVVVSDRASMESFANDIARFFEKLNRMADNPLLRMFSSLLRQYRKSRYYSQVADSLKEWREEKKDHLFHGATAGIVVAMKPGASTGPEDALLASQNILLAAHAAGLGTCLVGFAVEAMKRDKSIQANLGIPEDETVYSVIAVGKPAVTYRRPAGRRVPVLRK